MFDGDLRFFVFINVPLPLFFFLSLYLSLFLLQPCTTRKTKFGKLFRQGFVGFPPPFVLF